MSSQLESPRPAQQPASQEQVGDGTQERVLRTLLQTFIALTGCVTIIALVAGEMRRAALSSLGAVVYPVLLLSVRRLGVRRAGYLCTGWYFLLATVAMASGRGIYDVTIVLFPAGMFIGAMLLDRRHVLPMIVLAVMTVAGIGVGSRLAPLSLPVVSDPPQKVEIAVVALLLLVAGAFANLIVGSLQEAITERHRAEEALGRSKSELEARNEALQIINELAYRLQRSTEIESIAGQTIDVLVHHRRPPSVGFYLLDDSGTQLNLIASHGFTPEELALGAHLPVEGSLSGLAVRELRPVLSDDLSHDERLRVAVVPALAKRGITRALSVPLAFGGKALGTLALLYGEERLLTRLDIDTFQAMGHTVALAIANARHVAGLEHQALHDSLTGLPNRVSLHRRFLVHEARGQDRVGLLLLGLNQFREINEAFGHHTGDRVLARIAERLIASDAVEQTEAFRLGGDEFAVLLPSVSGREQADAKVRHLLAALRQPLEGDLMSLEIGASGGFALYPDDGNDSHELLRCADVAMSRAKQDVIEVAEYSPDFDKRRPERLAMIFDLKKAIRASELSIHFQPIIALHDGETAGFEALVRWSHPGLGLLSPADFLPLAEASDVIHPLTYWVVENALIQLRNWSALLPGLTMAINLSVRNLLERDCAQKVDEIMHRVGVDPNHVVFELTETAVMTDPNSAHAMLGRITATGAQLAIDDFGTGYSSLTYLKRFPVSVIKIDRSFVSDMASGGPSLAIVRSTVQLAQSLGLGVVAEGIEDRETADALRAIGCDLAQGYFFARPVPASEVGALLSSHKSLLSPAAATWISTIVN